MLTHDDMQLIGTLLSDSFEKKFAEQKSEIKQLVREEVEVLDGKIVSLGERINTVDAKITTLDMKIETYNAKLHEKIDRIHNDMKVSFVALHNTMDELNENMGKRVARLEKHVGIA